MASCPLCRQRKARRRCPAKGSEICSQCCGTKRRVEIACPPGCVYLGDHAGGWPGRETERRRDLRRLAPRLQGLDEDQARLFFLALAGINGLRAGRRELDDRLLTQAVSTLRQTVETRSRGILYEHTASDPRAQALMLELKPLFEAGGGPSEAARPNDSDLLAALGALEGCLVDAGREEAGATAFLDSAARMLGRLQGEPTRSRPTLIQP